MLTISGILAHLSLSARATTRLFSPFHGDYDQIDITCFTMFKNDYKCLHFCFDCWFVQRTGEGGLWSTVPLKHNPRRGGGVDLLDPPVCGGRGEEE